MSFILAALDKLTYFLSLIAFCISLSYSWLKWELIHLIWSGFGIFYFLFIFWHFRLIARGLWQLFSLGCIIDMPQLQNWPLWVCSLIFEMRMTDVKFLSLYIFTNNCKNNIFFKNVPVSKRSLFYLCRCYWWKTDSYENKRMPLNSVLRICHILLLAPCICSSEDFDWTKNEKGSFQYGTFPSGKA